MPAVFVEGAEWWFPALPGPAGLELFELESSVSAW